MFVTLPDNTAIYYNVNGEEKLIDDTKNTLLVLHGGPGISDHTLYLPFWSKLQTVIQVVFIDMRGHGRSEGYDTPAKWTLAQWGQDIYDFCVALNIKKPIVAGVSFGGWVTLAYATQFPTHARGLMLCHTEAKVEIEVRKHAYMRKAHSLNQDETKIADIIQQLFDWKDGTATMSLYINHCLPLYSKKSYSPNNFSNCIRNPEVWKVFGKKQYEFNFLPLLHKITAPTLILTGEHDPEHPPEFAVAMAEQIPHAHLAIIKDAGVPAYFDKEEETLAVLSAQIRDLLFLSS